MSAKTLYIVQQFERMGKKLVAGRAMEFENAVEAVARAGRIARQIGTEGAAVNAAHTTATEACDHLAVLRVRHEAERRRNMKLWLCRLSPVNV